jgi:hypothetical protein
LKERVIWRNEFETIDQARAAIGAYVDHDHDRPHLGIDYRTPKGGEATWEDAREEFDGLQNRRPDVSTRGGSGPLDPRIHR